MQNLCIFSCGKPFPLLHTSRTPRDDRLQAATARPDANNNNNVNDGNQLHVACVTSDDSEFFEHGTMARIPFAPARACARWLTRSAPTAATTATLASTSTMPAATAAAGGADAAVAQAGSRSLAAEARAALRSGHFIAGVRVPPAAAARAIPLLNPATGEQLHTVHEATPEQVDAAVQSARAALHPAGIAAGSSAMAPAASNAGQARPFYEFTDADRAALLSGIADKLAERRERIAACVQFVGTRVPRCVCSARSSCRDVLLCRIRFSSSAGIPAHMRCLRPRLLPLHLPRRCSIEALNTGKPLREAAVDVDDAIGAFRHCATLAATAGVRAWRSVDIPVAAGVRGHVIAEPVGVVAAIKPWNYPLMMAAWSVAPALGAGCPVVLKPSEFTPYTALELADAAAAAGAPPGALNVVVGAGAVGTALSTHRSVAKVSFTGSLATGSRVMRAAADDMKRVTLELGGKSPAIVFADAALDAAVEWLCYGVFWNAGQICSATSRVLVHESIYDKLVARLVQAATGMVSRVAVAPPRSLRECTAASAA